MYFVFGDLPQINNSATPSEISCWKKNPLVKKCHKLLFKKTSNDESQTYMTKIIDKIWKNKKDAPKIQIAYAISVCETMLDPSNYRIQMSEHFVKARIFKNLVSSKIAMKLSCKKW